MNFRSLASVVVPGAALLIMIVSSRKKLAEDLNSIDRQREQLLGSGFRRVQNSEVPHEIQAQAVAFLATRPPKGQSTVTKDFQGRSWALVSETHFDEARGEHPGVSALLQVAA